MSATVTVERDAVCRTRDGVALRADIYRPEGVDGPLPVLLTRTPYNKMMPLNADACRAIAAGGYIAVTQDIRGTHASDGEYGWVWDPDCRKRQGEDGYDAVEWAARLPGADGRVGTFGVSYMSHCSWALAMERPPSLKSMHVGGMVYSSLDMNFGIFDLGRRMQWMFAQAADLRKRGGRTDGPLTREAANAEWLGVLAGKWIWHLPIAHLPANVLDDLDEPYRIFLGRQNQDVLGYGAVHQGLDIPVCTVTGWWDRLSACVEHFVRLQAGGSSGHRLIVGPWSHAPSTMRRQIGPHDCGPEADYLYPEQVTDWYDQVFKGRPRRRIGEAAVRLLLVNEPDWREFPAWPPPEAQMIALHLHSGGAANSVHGDGSLSPAPPGDEPADHYTYDPADPFMSLFGADSHNLPVDQSPAGHRRDNLVYQTPALERDMVLAGTATLELWAASDAPDTDFAVKLVEVGADGLALNITSGIMRARYRLGYDREVRLEPGRPTLFRIRLLPLGIRFRAGSRIRLDIASSDFPAFDRNHNTGGYDYGETELRVAHQSVLHDRDHPSRLLLPLLPD